MNCQRLRKNRKKWIEDHKKEIDKNKECLDKKINEVEELQKATLDEITHQTKLKKEKLTVKNQKLVEQDDIIKTRSISLQNEIKKCQDKYSECTKEERKYDKRSSKIEGMIDIHKLSIGNLKNMVDHSSCIQKQLAEATDCWSSSVSEL